MIDKYICDENNFGLHNLLILTSIVKAFKNNTLFMEKKVAILLYRLYFKDELCI